MRIQHNIMAMNAYRNYNANTSALSKNLEKLSSGYKINRAGDDAAGLAISEKMRAQITGLETAQKNAKDGISLVQTAEGALTEVHDMLNRMVELANQSANGTFDNATDRAQLQKEVVALKDEIDRIADSANFNGISLLDGSMAAQDLTESGVLDLEQLLTKGLTIDPGKNGGGAKGEYTLDINELFGAGDTFEVKFQQASGSSITAPANVTLTYGTDFSGKTKEEQAKSIADALSKKPDIAKHFDITVDGTSVVLTNKVEGGDQPQVAEYKLNDKVTKLDTTNTKESTPAAAGTTAVFKFTKLFAADGEKLDVKVGDIITLEMKDAKNNIWKVNVTVTDDMIDSDSTKTAENIGKALEDAHFEDITGTVANESSMKLGDLFTIGTGTSKTALELTGKAGTEIFTNAATIKTNRTSTITADGVTAGGNDGTAAVYTVKFDTTNGAGNLTIGDQVKLKGQLSDGRTFEILLEAGKDFELGNTLQDTMTDLVNKLNAGSVDVTLTDDEGKTQVVKSSDIFGANKEMTLAATTDGMTITSNTNSDALNGKIDATSGFTLEKAVETDVSSDLVNGIQQTAAESTITFDDKLQYGSIIKIGDTTYEIVKELDDLSNKNNKGIVVSDLTNSAAVAQSVAEAINKNIPNDESGQPLFSVAAKGNTVTITTTAKGSDVTAIEIGTDGDTSYSKSFKLDPSKIKAGSYLTINGQRYEFVEEGKKPTDKNSIGVTLKDNAIDLANELAAVADGKNGSVKVAEDGTITVKAANPGDKPEVEFYDGLTLQIGDTSDDFNQLNVSIRDCHIDSLGLADIDIGSQTGAKESIDKIKDAINYVSDVRGTLGATQNRLDHTMNNLSVMTENIQDAESTIRDTDVADEMMAYTKNNILIQSAQAMLAQANQVPQGVLQLLQ